MQSHAEKILDKLKTLIAAATSAKIERNSVISERIPPTGLVIIRDGNPDAEYVLGGFSNVYYSHNIEIEIYIQEGETAQRDRKYDELMQVIGEVLEAHPTLDGLVAGLTYGRPEPTTQPLDGGPPIKFGVILLLAEYETATPLT